MVPLRLAQIGFTYAQTFLLTRAIDLLSEQKSRQGEDDGYGIIGATFVTYVGIAVCSHLLHSSLRLLIA